MTELPTGGEIPTWNLQDRLQKALDFAGVSRSEMADLLGVNRNTVGNYVAGRTRIPRASLLVWAMRCGVSLNWVNTGEGQATPSGDGPGAGTFEPVGDSGEKHSPILTGLAQIVHPNVTDVRYHAQAIRESGDNGLTALAV